MTQVASKVMTAIYGQDVWSDFTPIETTDDPQGWNGNHPSLGRLVTTERSRIVIDVGAWKGQSTITLARAMKSASIDGCVIAVDTFLGSFEHWIAGRPNAVLKMSPDELFKRPHGMPNLFQMFMSNVWKAGLQDYVVPLPQVSGTAARLIKFLGIAASVIHIDAGHEYEEVSRDIRDYWNILEVGGYMIGDDYQDMWPGVVQAAGEFSAARRLALTIEPPKWILRKRSS